MATVIAAKARDAKRAVFALQVLVYPATDVTSFDTASYQEFGEDHFLTRSLMEQFVGDHIPRVDDPALVTTGECDPLRDEGEAYAKRMQGEGVFVTLE